MSQRTVQIVGTKIAYRNVNDAKRPSKVLSYQHRKKLMQEAKEKIDRDLAIVKTKILVRKFAYIWIRKHFYSKRMFSSAKKLLLPSQLE